MNDVSETVHQGRKLARWCQEGQNRQGDAYLAAIYFFTNSDPSIIKVGLNLINWAINEAIIKYGCGRHIVPSENIARSQHKALANHYLILPKAIRRIGLIINQVDPTDPTKTHVMLNQIFLELLVTPNICLDARKFRSCQKDAQTLADYFEIGFGTLMRAVKLA